ncbi:nicotinate phosphoribosyltransferase [Magnetococcus sp. PR-3]|uniref:nicotinate phosphoribosyltransferase n=1 Tax=Magnetococcus sp. PR-3 TaxID=3120355 RepID=UPI002FCE2762
MSPSPLAPISALLTDLYQLTMLQSYWQESMQGEAIFEMTIRRLPHQRNFLIAAGIEEAVAQLEQLRFSEEDIDYLQQQGLFKGPFLAWLKGFRFSGDIYALPEGTLFFPPTPLLQVVAPLPQAQLVETLLMNQIHYQTAIASKGARVKIACGDKGFMEFGLRRTYGQDAGIQASRCSYLAGADATSNVVAGRLYDIPISGTMAHAFVMAHESELAAFRAYQALYPKGALLVDTYDTLEGVKNVIRLRDENPSEFAIRAIRLDSGDLNKLARTCRQLLDGASLQGVAIYASGGLDEQSIAQLESQKAPIDAYAVGTNLGVCADAPYLECAYKCVWFDGRPLMKKAPGKLSYPGQKQLYRHFTKGGGLKHDLLELSHLPAPEGSTPLLQQMMRGGQLLAKPSKNSLVQARSRVAEQLSSLPEPLKNLTPADPQWRVELGSGLLREIEQLTQVG